MANVFPIERRTPEQPATKGDIDRLLALLGRSPARRRLTLETKALHVRTIEAYFAQMCPCCGDRQVVGGGQRSCLGEFDHWSDNPSRSGAHETWLICKECHGAFTRHVVDRHDYRVEWDAYQKRRRKAQLRTAPLLL